MVPSGNKQIHPQTVLVSCPNWVGDVVMATPTFDCIRQNYPQSQIIGLIRKYAKGVVEEGPWFNQIIEVNDKTTLGFLNLVQQIRRIEPDLAIVLPNSFRSALIAKLGGIKKIYGYRRNGRTILMNGGPYPRRNGKQIIPVPMTEYYLEICRWLNLTVRHKTKPSLFISKTLRKKAEQLFSHYEITPNDMVVGLNPGAKFGSSKCWPPEYFAKLAELIAERWNCKLMLFLGPGEEVIGQEIVKKSKTKIINTGPYKVDLALLKPLVQRCQLLVTNDTGPRHYAVALDIPVVVIMGPTDPRYTHSNLEKTIVLRQDSDCSPCHLQECTLDHSCMTEISPQKVLQAGEQLLRKIS